jgi:hypothetical protein
MVLHWGQYTPAPNTIQGGKGVIYRAQMVPQAYLLSFWASGAVRYPWAWCADEARYLSWAGRFCREPWILGLGGEISGTFRLKGSAERKWGRLWRPRGPDHLAISEKVALRCSQPFFDHSKVRFTATSKLALRPQTLNLQPFRFTKNGYRKNLNSRSELPFPVLQRSRLAYLTGIRAKYMFLIKGMQQFRV